MTAAISRDAIARYTQTVGIHKLLLPEEERSLLAAVAQGDRRAKEKLVQHNLRLVVFVVKKYLNAAGNLEVDDLIQEGTIGLQTAIERFDLNHGGKLSTYAVWWIRQGVTRAIQNGSRTVRLPSHRYEDVQAIRKTVARLQQEYGRKATLTEIAAALGKDTAWVTDRLTTMRPIASLDSQLSSGNHKSEGDEGSLSDLVGVAGDQWETAIASEEREHLTFLLSRIPVRYAVAIRLRYGLDDGQPQTLERVGETLGVSKTAASNFVSKGVRLLRQKATFLCRQPSQLAMNTQANYDAVLTAIRQAEQAAIADGSYSLPSRNKIACALGLRDYFYKGLPYSAQATAFYNEVQTRLAVKKAEVGSQESGVRSQESVQAPPTLLAPPASLLSSHLTPHPTPHTYQQRLEAEIERLQAENAALRTQSEQQGVVNDDRLCLQALKQQEQQLRTVAARQLDQIAALEQERQSLLSKADLLLELVEQQEALVAAKTASNGHSNSLTIAEVVS